MESFTTFIDLLSACISRKYGVLGINMMAHQQYPFFVFVFFFAVLTGFGFQFGAAAASVSASSASIEFDFSFT